MKYASSIQDGVFYTFSYIPANPSLLHDKSPLIYCIRPSLKSLDSVVGLNFHHLPVQAREALIEGMQRQKNFMQNGKRTLFTEEELNSIFPGAKIAIREYNRRRIFSCYAIDNEDFPSYIYSDGLAYDSPKNSKMLDRLIKAGLYKA